jgi:hypothetical protein
VDQSAEHGLSADLVWRGWERDVVRAVVGGAQVHVVSLVAAAGVVVPDVLGQDRVQVSFAGDEHPVGAFGADGVGLGNTIRGAMWAVRRRCSTRG